MEIKEILSDEMFAEREQIELVLEHLNEYAESFYGEMSKDSYDTLSDNIKEIDALYVGITFNEMSTDARCLYNDALDFLREENEVE